MKLRTCITAPAPSCCSKAAGCATRSAIPSANAALLELRSLVRVNRATEPRHDSFLTLALSIALPCRIRTPNREHVPFTKHCARVEGYIPLLAQEG